MACFENSIKKIVLIRFQFLIVGLIVASSGNAIAQSSEAAAELLVVQQERFDAAISKDISKLEQMVAEEVRYCHTTGAVDTKSSYLETVRTGGIAWLEVEPIGMEARIYGDVEGLSLSICTYGRLMFTLNAMGAGNSPNFKHRMFGNEKEKGGRVSCKSNYSDPFDSDN
jgi:hypothetical protein